MTRATALASPPLVSLASFPMTPRPIYKWKSFWLGILVLIFTGWGWVQSMTYADGVGWSRGRFGAYARIWDGTLSIGTDNEPRSPGLDVWHLANADRELDPMLPKFVRDPKLNKIELTLPFWLVILLFLLPWSAFLAWRWRRQRNLTNTTA
jgi:hypothetical protein